MQVSAQEEKQIQASRELAAQVPMNEFGLPLGVYRTDMLPWHDYMPSNPKSIFETKQSEAVQLREIGSTKGKSAVTEAIAELGINIDVEDEEDDVEVIEPEINGYPVEVVEPEVEVVEERRVAGFRVSDLENAFVWLHYDEGFPAFEDGQPFWTCLPFEPPAAFAVFQRYLQMHQGKPAEDPDDTDDYGEIATGTRSIAVLSEILHDGGDSEIIPVQDTYQTYYHLYYWNFRAKAYDIFRLAAHRKQMEIRAIETQDSHYIIAQKLLNKLQVYFDNEEDFTDMMTPAVAVKALQLVTQLQRVSVGLPATGPAKVDDSQGAGQSLELVIRQLAQEGHAQVEDKSSEDMRMLDHILKDKDSTQALQEIVIKLTGGRNG
tara:strand:- start:1034 stop:2161 length:1128 start_codon:yes stop_codon:yes gene_type:complete